MDKLFLRSVAVFLFLICGGIKMKFKLEGLETEIWGVTIIFSIICFAATFVKVKDKYYSYGGHQVNYIEFDDLDKYQMSYIIGQSLPEYFVYDFDDWYEAFLEIKPVIINYGEGYYRIRLDDKNLIHDKALDINTDKEAQNA
jgi:hypothetical protein